jgi:hypothetical protein
LHGDIATDRRNPTVKACGMIYGSPELSTDDVSIIDSVFGGGGWPPRRRAAALRLA